MQRLDYLRAAINENTCTVDELREYCALAFEARPGTWLQDPVNFVPDDAMLAFNWLKGWWKPPSDCPKSLDLNLLAMLWGIYVPYTEGGGSLAPTTLNDKVIDFYNRACAYYQSHGMDPANPQESDEERRKRKQRDRMSKLRETRKVPDKELTDDIRSQVRQLEADIEQVKANAKIADEERRLEVIRFQEQMIEAAQARKDVAQGYKDEVERLRAEIKQLTGKQ